MTDIFVPPYDMANLARRLGDIPYETLNALDLGCGAYESDVAKQIATMPFLSLTSVEGYRPDFDRIPSVEAKEHIKVCGDVVTFVETNKKKFDITFMMDVLEHLPRETGEKLLLQLEKFSKKIVILVPDEPDGFHRKDGSGNPLQAHVSYWREDDLVETGYRVERIKDAHSEQEGWTYKHFDALWCMKP